MKPANRKKKPKVKYSKEEREKFLFRTADEMRDIHDAIEKRFKPPPETDR